MEHVDLLAAGDPEYQNMLAECRVLEKQVLKILEGIPSEDNELIWDFIMLCETMSLRKLQLACGWLHDGGECPRAALKKAGRIDFA